MLTPYNAKLPAAQAVQEDSMRRVRLGVGSVSIVLFLCASAFACGDKLLVLGRGMKFDTINGSLKGSIILYMPADLSPTAAVNDAQFHAGLKKAGHKLFVAPDMHVLAEAVRSGKYDLILADVRDAGVAEDQVSATNFNTVVMPVVYEGVKLEGAAARYGCIRKSPSNNRSCFSTIEKALESKFKRDQQQRASK
jgi:hypothetical protein